MYAKFIGKDGSQGFRKGEVYDIETFVRNKWIWVQTKRWPNYNCPYTNVENILANWSFDKG